MIRVLLNVPSPALRAGLRALLTADKTIKVVNDSLEEESEADVMITSASDRRSSSSNESLIMLIVLSDESRARNPARNAGDDTFSKTRITSSHLPLR